MILYFIRHADPIYNPDSITEHGKKQANVLAKRLVEIGINKLYCSSSNRAIMTMIPTAKKLNLNYELLDFAREDLAADEFGIINNNKWSWCFQDIEMLKLFNNKDVKKLNDKWFDHECFKNYKFKDGITRIDKEADKFLEKLGYHHDRLNGCFIAQCGNDDKVALFAHGGFSMAFISSILDIPYNLFCLHFEHLSTSCIISISFIEEGGIVLPKIITYSDYSHLYKNNLRPFHYNNAV